MRRTPTGPSRASPRPERGPRQWGALLGALAAGAAVAAYRKSNGEAGPVGHGDALRPAEHGPGRGAKVTNLADAAKEKAAAAANVRPGQGGGPQRTRRTTRRTAWTRPRTRPMRSRTRVDGPPTRLATPGPTQRTGPRTKADGRRVEPPGIRRKGRSPDGDRPFRLRVLSARTSEVVGRVDEWVPLRSTSKWMRQPVEVPVVPINRCSGLVVTVWPTLTVRLERWLARSCGDDAVGNCRGRSRCGCRSRHPSRTTTLPAAAAATLAPADGEVVTGCACGRCRRPGGSGHRIQR